MSLGWVRAVAEVVNNREDGKKKYRK